MNENEFDRLDLRSATGGEITRVFRRGVAEALRAHERAGNPVVVWEDGRVVHVPADEIAIPADPSDDSNPGDQAAGRLAV